MKICKGCQASLPAENFYVQPDGNLRPRCKACWTKQCKRWKAANPEKVLEWATRYQKAHPEKARAWNNEATQRWKANNKDKRKAQHKVSNSVRDKKLARRDCVVCAKHGIKASGQAHHSDYNKPLEITWLCHKHHRAWHKVLIAEEAIK